MKKQQFIFLLITIVFLILSCASSPEEKKQEDKGKPEWITNRPDSTVYYIGIGGSETGNQADDKEIARSRALAELSSEIFASIESSLDIQATDSSETGETYLVEQNIRQKVEQDLEALETVDTWYSQQDGYWYYMRLSRMEWEAIQERRARDMRQRIEEMFAGVFRDTLSELKTIDRAYSEYRQNYTGNKVSMELFGQTGSIDTLLLLRAEDLLKGITLPAPSLPDRVTQMEQISLRGTVLCGTGRNPGAFALEFLNASGEILQEIPLDPDGNFDWLYTVKELPGEGNFTYRLKSPLTNRELLSQLDYALPSESSSTSVQALVVQMLIEGEGSGLYSRSFEILDSITPFTLTDRESEKKISLSFSFHEAPPNDFGLVISYGRCYVGLITSRGEDIVWQSEEVKSGGLTEEQARGKVTDKLLETVRNDAELNTLLHELTF